MPNLTAPELQVGRRYLTLLLAASAFGQGVQYAARPTLPLESKSYAALLALGETGWVVVGLALATVGLWVAFAPRRLTYLGFYAGGLFYVLLMVGQALSLVVPATLLIPAGICLGEVFAHALQGQRLRRER